jgi:hypothetical protein
VSIQSSFYTGVGGLLAALLGFSDAHAQRDAGATSQPPTGTRDLCWRARPAARCRTYLVTDVGYEHPVISSRLGAVGGGFEPDPDFAGRFVVSIGVMANRGPSTAWGGVASVATGEDPEKISLRAEVRRRKWIGPTRGIDISAGVAHKQVPNEHGELIRANGVTAAIGVERWLARAEARADALYGGGRARTAVLVGVRASSYAAPVAAVVITAVGFAVAVSNFE